VYYSRDYKHKLRFREVLIIKLQFKNNTFA